MPSIINASTAGAGGVITTADSSGVLQLQAAGTTAITIDTSQNVGIGTTSPAANSLSIARGASTSAAVHIAGNGNTPNVTSLTLEQGAASDVYIWNRANQLMSFGTNNTERMRIDSSGRVTMPFQPCFRATRSSGTANFTGNTTLIYDVALVNVGTCYNTSTGIFTAPVAGSYAFSYSYYTDNTTSEMVDLVLNNATIMGRTEVRFNPGDNSVIASGMIIYGLSANDNVRVKNTNVGVAQLIGGENYIYFNGFLIG